MMIIETAPAKLNLALHVRARRPDGYHELETLFAFTAFGDEVRVAPADATRLEVVGPFAGALAGEGDNLVTRAAARFRETFGGGHHAITLEKRLPVASGIGGGSADAAATLRALARLQGIDQRDPELFSLAAGLGSDVPACLLGRTAFGRGRGEQLEPVDAVESAPALLVNPGVAVSTAAIFAKWDGIDRGPLDPARPWNGRNDLEPPARAVAPVIGEVVAALAARPGARHARMSGSGATCFALFADVASRDAAARALARPGWWVQPTQLLA